MTELGEGPEGNQMSTELTPTILNVLRVALDRADLRPRTTGFFESEIQAAKNWVRDAKPSPEWDENPDGIKVGKERGMRMNSETGAWE